MRIIGEKVGLTSERVRQYILATGQHDTWRKSRRYFGKGDKKEQKRKKMLGILISQIKDVGRLNVPENDKETHEKTAEYFSKLQFDRGSYSFDQIFDLFRDYYNAKRDGKSVSIELFAKRHETFTIQAVGRVFSRVGLETLCNPNKNRKKRVVTPKYKKDVLKRSVTVEMPSSDIAFFLGVPANVISMCFSKY